MASTPDMRLAALFSPASLKWHARRAAHFALVSGLGLALDITLFLILVRAHVSPFVANVLSSATGLSFVYCVSVRRIFRYHGRFIVPLFAAYVLYHVCGTLTVSEVVSLVIHAGLAPALTKVGILPMTFTANYLFMSWLTRKRERWILEMGG